MFTPDRRSIFAAGCRVADPSPSHRRHHHPDFDKRSLQGWRAVHREATLPQTAWKAERERAIRMGLAGADSIEDRSISTFARGELPHYAGINTFLKAPYVENVRDVGKYDAAILGVPFDGGTTFRPGTRFGPQGIRRISALYTPYNFEIGVDLREQMTRTSTMSLRRIVKPTRCSLARVTTPAFVRPANGKTRKPTKCRKPDRRSKISTSSSRNSTARL
jgi:agmatinase